MADQRFDCTVCGEYFIVTERTLADPSRVLACPCCGSTEVVSSVWDEEPDRLLVA